MRESLTLLAILLIAVLTTALVGPYFVDWNAHRAAIEARLSTLVGAKVTVSGPIDAVLLPRPIFKLQGVRVGGTTGRDGALAVDRLDMELALTALLRGQINFVDADLTRPRLTLVEGADRTLVLPGLVTADPDRVSLDRIAIHDGGVTLAGGNGTADLALTGIEGEAGAESLAGPFHFAGHLDAPRGTLGLRLSTGAYADGRLRLKAALDATPGSPRTDIEGTIATGPAADRASALSFDGTVSAGGTIPLDGTKAVIPWQVTARVKADAAQVEASGIELRAGTDGRAVVADGAGRWAPGTDGGVAHLSLRAPSLDVTKLAAPRGPAAPQAPPSSAADVVAAAQRFATDADAFGTLPVPVALAVSADTVTIGSETLTGLDAAVTLASGQPAVGRVAIGAGDGTKVSLEGSFEPGPAAVFKGRAEASTRDLGRFADALAADLPDAASALKTTLPVKAVSFAGGLDLSAVGFAAQDATLELDRSRFAGTLTLTRAVGNDRARFFADLASDALDLDALPDWRDAAASASDLDLSISLAARAVQLARTDLGTVEAGRITLQLSKTGSAVSLDRLILSDLGGATADLSGSSDGHTAHLAGRFDARRLHDLAALLGRLAPNPLTAGLAARADVLSPALLKVSADASVADDGTLTPTDLALDGTAAGTVVALHLKPVAPATPQPGDPLAPFRPDRAPVILGLSLDAPEAGALLRQIGLSTPPATAIGRGHLDAGLRVNGTGGLDGSVSATFGPTVLTVRGRGTMDGEATGHAALHGPNVAPLLRALTLAVPETGAVWPLEAEADMVLRGGRIATRGLAGQVIGTRFSGDLAYALPTDDPVAGAALTGSLDVDRLPLPVLAGLALGPLPAPKPGAVWPDTPFAPPSANLPRTEVAVAARSFPLTDAEAAHGARLTLRLAPGVVTVADLAAHLGDGQVGGTLTLRRDGPSASLSGRVDWSGLPLATPALGGTTAGGLELAGTGRTVASLIASLAGNGTIGIADARLPRFDPGAIARVLAASDAATGPLEPDAVADGLGHELDRSAFALGPVTAPVTVAAGVLRSESVKGGNADRAVDAQATLDLRSLALTLRATAAARALPADWSGDPPQVSVLWTGPVASPARTVDAAALVNGLAARAIVRDQARIDAFQDDVRERAFFARRLKAIEEEQAAKAAASLARPAPPRPVARPGDGLSQLLDGLKPPPAVPRPHVAPPRPGSPLDLQRPPAPAQAAAPSGSPTADPGASGQY